MRPTVDVDPGNSAPPVVACDRDAEGTLRVSLGGVWRLCGPTPPARLVEDALRASPPVRRLRFEADGLGAWDSSLLTFLDKVRSACAAGEVEVVLGGLPEGARRLLALAAAVPERAGARRGAARVPVVARVGLWTLAAWSALVAALVFLGEAVLAFLSLLRGKARFRWKELLALVEECGPRAIPIVSLISFLVGLILAFVGAVQLKMFGAQIYIANLVGLGMAREMAAMMTGIILAGRTGAAYAAKLGTMMVNEEIDALRTLGINPIERLVLPRVLALAFATPILCLLADLMGILGGAFVCVGLFDISVTKYYEQTVAAVPPANFVVGVVKCMVYGVIVALAGCQRGMACGRSAAAVGESTTSAVVTAIVWIVVACAGLTVLCDRIGV